MTTRLHLEKYRGKGSRYRCPQCGEDHQFTRYVDENNQHLAPHVGKCNRVDKCGYHYPPRQYYADNPVARSETKEHRWRSATRKACHELPTPPAPQVLPDWVVDESMSGKPCNFIRFLASTFGEEAAHDLRGRFQIGSNHDLWPDSTVFWIVGHTGQPYAAQVIQYDANTGKTVKYRAQDGRRGRRAGWIHTSLKKRYQHQNKPLPSWLSEYADNAPKYSVPFGLQLLNNNQYEAVAVVEAAKTAVIMSHFCPEYLWLAVGSLSNLTAQRLEVIKDQNIILYPDAGRRAFEAWSAKAQDIKSAGFKICCSDLLEQFASEDEYQEGYDLADYFLTESRRERSEVTNNPSKFVQNQSSQRVEELPPRWSRNVQGELCDEYGLPILYWWMDLDLEQGTESQRNAVQRELTTIKSK